MNRSYDPLKEYREMMAKMSDPLKEYREMMAKMSDPLKEYREMMAKMSDPLKGHREMMAKISGPPKEYGEMMAKMSDPLKEYGEMMAKMSDPLKEYREVMAKMSDPLKGHREMMAKMSDPLTDFQNTISNNLSFDRLKNIALEVQESLTVDSNGDVLLESRRIAADELQTLSDQIFQNTGFAKSCCLEESIENLISAIQSQKDPWAQKLLMWYVFPFIMLLISSIIDPIVEHNLKPLLNSDKKLLVKELKSSVHSIVPNKEVLSSLRYVSADVLNVRSSASTESEIVGYLYFSSSVIVLQENKDWTLVEWNEPDGDLKITGWVFSSYLKKFQ